jgi:hypothetical protein
MDSHGTKRRSFPRFVAELLYALWQQESAEFKHSRIHLNLTVGKPIQKEITMFVIDKKVTTEEKILVTMQPTKTEGGVLVLPINPPVVTLLSGEGSVEVVDNANFYLMGGTNVGVAVFSVTADFDPNGDGLFETVTDQLELTVGEAQILGFGFSTAEAVLKTAAA